MDLKIKVDPFFVPVKVTANVKGGKTYTIPNAELEPKDLAEMADTWRKELFAQAGLKDPAAK